MVTRVVVAVDDSPGAEAALRWTEQLLISEREQGREVKATMVSAWSIPAIDTQAVFDDEPFRAASVKTLETLAEGLKEPDSFELSSRRGHPVAVILEEADYRDADLIVVGTRGRNALAQVLLGSVSRAVAARSTRPVAVIPDMAPTGETGTVVGFDNSPGAIAALKWALANRDGNINVVAAWQPPSAVVYDPRDEALIRFEAASEAALSTGVEAVCGGTIDERITLEVKPQDARIAVLHAAAEASLVVLGARGSRGLKGLLLGSTVTYVTCHATTPVVIVPPPAEDETEASG